MWKTVWESTAEASKIYDQQVPSDQITRLADLSFRLDGAAGGVGISLSYAKIEAQYSWCYCTLRLELSCQ